MSQDPNTVDDDGAGPPPDEHSEHPGSPEADKRPREIGGRKGPDPTRFGDWEKNGRCIDF
ncbi:MAG: DUF1674 domain-containing protein [Pseudomonadota bacterium]